MLKKIGILSFILILGACSDVTKDTKHIEDTFKSVESAITENLEESSDYIIKTTEDGDKILMFVTQKELIGFASIIKTEDDEYKFKRTPHIDLRDDQRISEGLIALEGSADESINVIFGRVNDPSVQSVVYKSQYKKNEVNVAEVNGLDVFFLEVDINKLSESDITIE